MFALPAYLGVVVVNVFKDIAQADALGVAHDAHLVHGSELVFELALHEEEQIFQRSHLGLGVVSAAAFKAHAGFIQSFLHGRDVISLLLKKEKALNPLMDPGLDFK